jgi:hypothetical protein
VPPPGDPITRPEWTRQGTMGNDLDAAPNAVAITFNGRITPTGI